MGYREKRKLACQKLFQCFELDVSKSKDPEFVKKVCSLASLGFYTKEISEELGKTPKAIQKIYRRYNFPDMHNFFPPRMEERSGWKRGEKLMKGYLYRRMLEHPNGTKHGNYVAVHRLVVEEKLGRFLLPSEVVDHIDGDIQNNSPENLRVFSSNAEHLAKTRAGKIPQWTEEGKEKLRETADAKKKPQWTRGRVPVRSSIHF